MKHYNPQRITVIFGGLIVEHFAPGTFLELEVNQPSFTTFVGVNGEVARAMTKDKTGSVTFSLISGALENDILSGIHNLELVTPGGNGIVPLLVLDRNGRTLVAATYAWVRGFPRVDYSEEAPIRKWVIDTGALNVFAGGT